MSEQKTINSDSRIYVQEQKTINSNTFIRYKKDFYSRVEVENNSQKDFYNQLRVNQPIPADISGLTATDPEIGDSIILDWDEDSNYGYNVYKDVAGWVKQNDTVLTTNSCIIGSLTTGVQYTFQVRGVNGAGVESAGITITGTVYPNDTKPSFSISHYTDADFTIVIGGVEQTDAVLERVELVYGTSLSTASFHIPKNPTTPGLPEATRQEVIVYIRDRKVFTGLLISRDDNYDSTVLRVNYTAVDTRYEETLYSMGIDVAMPEGYPEDLWEPVQAADLTGLEYRSFGLKYRGNYKIYCDENGNIGYYEIGKPITVRTFEVGKHILKSNIKTDWSNPPKQVTIYSAETQKTVCKSWSQTGNTKRINAKGISNVQVFAKINNKPQVVSYLDSVEVLPGHMEDIFGSFKFTVPSITFREAGETQSEYETRISAGADATSKWGDGGSEGRHPVSSYSSYFSSWQPVSAKIEYDEDEDGCSIVVSPTPKKWHKNIVSGTAKFITMSGDTPEESTLYVNIWNTPYWSTAIKKVVYTYQTSRRSKQSGSGIATKTIHENIIPISINVPADIPYRYESDDNYSAVDDYLQNRADIEAAKSSSGVTKGTMTVLGDETLNLRMQVNGLEVIKVIHDFSSGLGYVCHLDLTDESFYPGVIAYIGDEFDIQKNNEVANNSFITTYHYNQKKIEAIVGEQSSDQGEDPKAGIAHYAD